MNVNLNEKIETYSLQIRNLIVTEIDKWHLVCNQMGINRSAYIKEIALPLLVTALFIPFMGYTINPLVESFNVFLLSIALSFMCLAMIFFYPFLNKRPRWPRLNQSYLP